MTSPATLPDTDSDREILQQTYRELVDRHQDMVFAVCRRILRNDQDAGDATQEAFLRLWQRGDQIHTNPGAWLHACARSVSLNLMRSSTRRHRHERAVSEDPTRSNPAAGIEDDETRACIDACLDELAEKERHLVFTYFHEGLSFSQIGKREGVSKVAIKKRLDKILERLRIRLKNRLGVVPVAVLCGAFAQRSAASEVPAALTASLKAVPATSATLGSGAAKLGLVGWSVSGLAAAASLTTVLIAQPSEPVPDALAPTISGEVAPAGDRSAATPTTLELSSEDGSLRLRIEADGPVRIIDRSPEPPAARSPDRRISLWQEHPLTGELYRVSAPAELVADLQVPEAARPLVEADRQAAVDGAIEDADVAESISDEAPLDRF